jgi:fumarate reductase subunit D
MSNAAFAVLAALAFVALAIYAIKTGQVRLRHGLRVTRAASPLGFWLFVSVYFGVAAVLVVFALRAF